MPNSNPKELALLLSGKPVGYLKLAEPLPSRRAKLPTFPGNDDALVMYFALNGSPAAGLAFPFSQDGIEISKAKAILWGETASEIPPQDAIYAWSGKFKERQRRRSIQQHLPSAEIEFTFEMRDWKTADSQKEFEREEMLDNVFGDLSPWKGEFKATKETNDDIFRIDFRSNPSGDFGNIEIIFGGSIREPARKLSVKVYDSATQIWCEVAADTREGRWTPTSGVFKASSPLMSVEVTGDGEPYVFHVMQYLVEYCVRRLFYLPQGQFSFWVGLVSCNFSSVDRWLPLISQSFSEPVELGQLWKSFATNSDRRLHVTFDDSVSAPEVAKFLNTLDALLRNKMGQGLRMMPKSEAQA